MSPARFSDDDEKARKTINGPRPSPLRINTDSSIIQKSSLSVVSHSGLVQHLHQQQQQPQQRKPVIIYTESPKIIHAKAHDFMALVQKLTGLSQSDLNKDGTGKNGGNGPVMKKEKVKKEVNSEDDDHNKEPPSVVTTDEKPLQFGSRGSNCTNPYFADIPLFTPNSGNDFFCLPRPLFRYADMVSTPPNMGNSSLSPSFLEFMKGLPEY